MMLADVSLVLFALGAYEEFAESPNLTYVWLPDARSFAERKATTTSSVTS